MEENKNCCADCEECNDRELSPEQEEIISLVGEAFEKVMNAGGCPDCTLDALFELAYTVFDFGYECSQQDMREFLED